MEEGNKTVFQNVEYSSHLSPHIVLPSNTQLVISVFTNTLASLPIIMKSSTTIDLGFCVCRCPILVMMVFLQHHFQIHFHICSLQVIDEWFANNNFMNLACTLLLVIC
jgi:hypothetical protein